MTNSSLSVLDAIVAGAVEEPPRRSPPEAPALGACYLISDAPSDAWAGKAQCVASFTSGGWQFVEAEPGFSMYIRSTGTFALFRNGGWELDQIHGSAVVLGGQQVVHERGVAIGSPAGVAVVDIAAREAIENMLFAMRTHGLIET